MSDENPQKLTVIDIVIMSAIFVFMAGLLYSSIQAANQPHRPSYAELCEDAGGYVVATIYGRYNHALCIKPGTEIQIKVPRQ